MKVVPRSSRRTRTSISRRRRVLRGRRARATPLREFHQHSGPRDDEVGSEDGDGDGRELQRPDYGIRRSPCAGPSVARALPAGMRPSTVRACSRSRIPPVWTTSTGARTHRPDSRSDREGVRAATEPARSPSHLRLLRTFACASVRECHQKPASRGAESIVRPGGQ